MQIPARNLEEHHYGQHIKVKHVDGILRVVKKSGVVMEILAQNKDGGFDGVRVASNEPVEIEKTLENQVKDDLKNIADRAKSGAIKFLRKHF